MFRNVILLLLISFTLLHILFSFFLIVPIKKSSIKAANHSPFHYEVMHSCKQSINGKYLLMITSSWKDVNYAQRQAIRNTWKKKLPAEFKVLFALGTPPTNSAVIDKELQEYDDMIVFNTSDDYESLTKKTLCIIIFASMIAELEYLVKMDDDVYLRTFQFQQFIKEKNAIKNDWIGFVWHSAKPIRNSVSSNAELDYELEYYADYTQGSFYLLGKKLLSFLASRRDLLKIYRNEDASLGIWLQSVCSPMHDPRFQTNELVCTSEMITKHKVSAAEMIALYDNEREGREFCHGIKRMNCPLALACEGQSMTQRLRVNMNIQCGERGCKYSSQEKGDFSLKYKVLAEVCQEDPPFTPKGLLDQSKWIAADNNNRSYQLHLNQLKPEILIISFSCKTFLELDCYTQNSIHPYTLSFKCNDGRTTYKLINESYPIQRILILSDGNVEIYKFSDSFCSLSNKLPLS